MRRLLILSCSQRKLASEAELLAIHRYDGQAYRVLRGYLRATSDAQLDVHILSAKFGLIPSDRLVPWYDQKMTKQRAAELHDSVDAGLREIVEATVYEAIFVASGAIYRGALGNALDDVDADIGVTSGPIGVQLSQLKAWLYRAAVPEWPSKPTFSGVANQHIQLISTGSASDDVLQLARLALAADPVGAARFTVWRAFIDGQPVSVKWLLHQMTGKPLNSFTSQTAARDLRRMGFEVCES